MTLVPKPAPDFTVKAIMPDNTIQDVTLSAYRGRYVLLFFYPLDFTFVCPSEIIAFDDRLVDFKARHCEVLGCSVDSEYTHLAWKNTPRRQGGVGNVQFPMLADITKDISRDYGILVDNAVSLRGLFLIDKDGIVRHEIVNDLPLGRSVDEALRMVDALQHFEASGDVCPANWHKGEKAMKATAEGVADYLAGKEKA
jgi:peroxiredoxin (alkyl hydroperoxide reductase subunit C)